MSDVQTISRFSADTQSGLTFFLIIYFFLNLLSKVLTGFGHVQQEKNTKVQMQFYILLARQTCPLIADNSNHQSRSCELNLILSVKLLLCCFWINSRTDYQRLQTDFILKLPHKTNCNGNREFADVKGGQLHAEQRDSFVFAAPTLQC